MYSVVRVCEGGGRAVPGLPEAARARAEALGGAAGFVTLLAITGDDGALITVEIFETLDDLVAAQRAVGRDGHLSPLADGAERDRTITGEIVFQRGL